MRIAQIVNSLEVGGLERLCVGLAEEQQSGGHDPFIFCVARRGPLADEAERKGIPVSVLGKQTGFSPAAAWRLSREIREARIDVVHTHNALIHHYGLIAARLAGVKLVVNTQHGVGSTKRDPRLDRIFRLTLPFTSAVVVVSEQVRKQSVAAGTVPASKSHTILNGIAVRKFSAHRARPGERLPRVVFGTVGRLVLAKDHRTLLEAFSQVRRSLPFAELRIAGDGPLRCELEELIQRLGLQECVRLFGEVLDVPGFLSELDAFVLSSVTEALPLAVLEAMAAGLPIVATRVGGIEEVAPENSVAFYCECERPEELAQVLVNVAQAERLRAMGSAAFRHAQETATLSEAWRQYEQLFESLLVRPERPVILHSAN